MKNVAFILLGNESLLGGGGAERQFADIYDFYQNYKKKKFNLFFVIDNKSLRNLNSLNRLNFKDNLIVIPEFNSLPKKMRFLLWNFCILKSVIQANIHLLHVCLPRMMYLPSLYFLSKAQIFKRKVNIAFNATDCSIAYNYKKSNLDRKKKKIVSVYLNYMKYINFNGILSWYESFKNEFENKYKNKENKLISTVKYCFTIIKKMDRINKKERIVVWAGRFEDQKKPFIFLDAVRIINNEYKNILELGWKFYLYGEGSMREDLKHAIKKYKIGNLLSINCCDEMESIFRKSSIFVSTQDYENFTSLSMLEAMACGNIIISRNVGQTNKFVKDYINGFLLTDDSPENLACCLNECIENLYKYDYMRSEGVKIAKEEYKPEFFLNEIDKFWEKTLS